MSDLLLKAIHSIPEGSVVLIRSADTRAYDGEFLELLVEQIIGKVGHDQFVVVLLSDDETWQVAPARVVHEQLGRFLARVDAAS